MFYWMTAPSIGCKSCSNVCLARTMKKSFVKATYHRMRFFGSDFYFWAGRTVSAAFKSFPHGCRSKSRKQKPRKPKHRNQMTENKNPEKKFSQLLSCFCWATLLLWFDLEHNAHFLFLLSCCDGVDTMSVVVVGLLVWPQEFEVWSWAILLIIITNDLQNFLLEYSVYTFFVQCLVVVDRYKCDIKSVNNVLDTVANR